MNSFINVKKEFKPDQNFWELNPHLQHVKPFSFLYNRDTSNKKTQSSKDMWCVFYFSEPDEKINLYFRLDEEDLYNTCKSFNPDFSLEDDIILECIKEYPEKCLTVIERLLKTTKELFKKRNKFLKEAEYNFETMTPIDNAIAKTPKLEEDFDKIVQKYEEEQNKSIRLIGDRKQTAREKKLIRADLTNDTEFRAFETGSDQD